MRMFHDGYLDDQEVYVHVENSKGINQREPYVQAARGDGGGAGGAGFREQAVPEPARHSMSKVFSRTSRSSGRNKP